MFLVIVGYLSLNRLEGCTDSHDFWPELVEHVGVVSKILFVKRGNDLADCFLCPINQILAIDVGGFPVSSSEGVVDCL